MKIPFTNYQVKGFTVNRLPGQGISLPGESFTGINVTAETALTYTAYWACMRLLTGTIASLPLITYRRLARGKERATDHPLYALLHDEPNPEMDSFTFFETYAHHLIGSGNGYALIDWDDTRTVIQAIWIMRPDRVDVSRDSTTKEVVYRYMDDNRGWVVLPSYRVWHTPGLGFDGLIGYNPIRYSMQQIGLGLATEKFGSKLFGNGTAFGGFLKHPKTLSEPAFQRLKKQIDEDHGGLDKALKLKILEEGMEYIKNTINPEEAQFLETRKFQKREVASLFLVQPHKIGDMEQATFGNIEEQNIEFVVNTMRYWLVKIERSAKRKLVLPNEKANYFSEFLVDALLRGDFESRTRGYWTQIQSGILSPNEAREIENRNPREGGDQYLQPVNMVVSGQVPAQPPPKTSKQ